MIKKIKMNACLPYLQSEVSDCKKINFIFGANGSGKSTISSFLSDVDLPRFEQSSIEWQGEMHEKIEVYNKRFRQNNLQQEIQGVFTLGSATIDDINEVDLLKNELEQRQKDWEGYCTSYNKKTEVEKPQIEKNFRDDAWNQILKQNDSDFQKAFAGFRGSKDKFLVELKNRIIGIPNHEGDICERQQLINRANVLYSSDSERCERLVFDIEELIQQLDNVRNDDIWNTVIVGSADVNIAALIIELGNSSWVSQGRQYIMKDSLKCPFCQHDTIDESFRNQLIQFFDSDYKSKVNYLDLLMNEYTSITTKIIEQFDSSIDDKNTSIHIGKFDIENFSTKKELLMKVIDENIKSIEKKISEPETKILIIDIKDYIKEISDLFVEANRLIDAHNILIDKRETEEEKLRDDIWASCIHDADLLIKKYKKDISGIEKAINNIIRVRDEKKKIIDELKAKIEEKSKNITSVQPTIDEINRSLKAYGFTSFSIQPAEGKENYYCIKRDDGTYATNTLSEGEETFLTFLYFMQRAKGSIDKKNVSEKKIIVLDDPISSLDSTILYVVGAIVKDLTKKIREGKGDVTQLFVLTHNVFFHKEASFIDGRTQEFNDVNYWIIRKNNGISTIKPYGMKNPISTSYELLWKELQDNTGASLISIQNTMRRIIENYFGMLGGKRDDYLIEQFETTEDKMIARSLLYWINDGSHSIPDDLFIDPYTDAIPRYKDVFREIFRKSNHLAHYNMMMGINEENDNNVVYEENVS